MAYITILDADVTPGQPAFQSVMKRLRDNPIAIAQGDATVPAGNRVDPTGMKRPTSASQTQILAHQGSSQDVLNNYTDFTFFSATIVVPGVYTIAGTRTAACTVTVYKNDASILTPATGSFTSEQTLDSGDRIRIEVSAGGSRATLSDFRFLSEYAVPLAQCWFSRFQVEELP